MKREAKVGLGLLMIGASGLLAFLLSRKKSSPTPPPPPPPPPGEPESPFAYLYGTVIDAETNQPIPGAAVVISGQGRDQQVTGADGSYAFSNLTPGYYSISASKEGYAMARPQTVIAAKGDNELNLFLSPIVAPPPPAGVYLFGKVIQTETQLPISGAHVSLYQGADPIAKAFGMTDDSGNYQITGIDPGNYIITGAKDGFQLYQSMIDIIGGSNPLDIYLVPNPPTPPPPASPISIEFNSQPHCIVWTGGVCVQWNPYERTLYFKVRNNGAPGQFTCNFKVSSIWAADWGDFKEGTLHGIRGEAEETMDLNTGNERTVVMGLILPQTGLPLRYEAHATVHAAGVKVYENYWGI